jgi:hypothetical protein
MLLGVHRVQSGFTSIVRATPDDMEAYRLPTLPNKLVEELRAAVNTSQTTTPYQNGDVLFMGSLVECESATIYLSKDKTGLMIHSNHDQIF